MNLHPRTLTRVFARSFALCIAVCIFAAGISVAAAKPPQKRANAAKRAPKRAPKSAKARVAKKPAVESAREHGPSESAHTPAPESRAGESRADAQRRAAQDAALGADAQVVREGDTQVKVMSFSGLDIEGRLKSPQLLYFIGRVRAEFDRPTLPHRSFMPELDTTTHSAPLQ